MSQFTRPLPAAYARVPRRRRSLLGWLVALDHAFREREKMKRLDDTRLADLGLSRRDANAQFYHQFLEREPR